MSTTRSKKFRRLLATGLALGGIVAGVVGFVPSASAAVSDVLNTGQSLSNEGYIKSSNGYTAVMQADGNLVIYKPGATGRVAIWASHSDGHRGSSITMQTDGNLVMYDGRGPYWASQTSGRPGSYLVMQTDGNLVMYQPIAGGRQAIWASGSAQPGGVAQGGAPSTGSGRRCSPNLTLSLSKVGGSPSNLVLRVKGTRADCRVLGASFPAASGRTTDQCASNVGWLPNGQYLVGTYYQNGWGKLAGRSHFDIAAVSGTPKCKTPRGGFAIHSENGVKVPSTSLAYQASSNGCIKISGKSLTSLKTMVDNYRADGGQQIGLTVSG